MNKAPMIPKLDSRIQQLSHVSRFILLLLGANNYERVPGYLYLQKEMFLLQNLFAGLADEADYKPQHLGPHSKIVESEAAQLASSGLIMEEAEKLELTLEGRQAFDILKGQSNTEDVQTVEDFKELLNDMTRDELLAFVYFSYPSSEGFERESIEYKKLLPKRRQLAISMCQKDKISAQKAVPDSR